MEVKRLATNSVLDELINGGLEHRAITNIYGPAGSGKTNFALKATLSILEQGKKVIYIDTEGSFSFERFNQLGGREEQLSNLLFFEPADWDKQHQRIKELEDTVNKEKIGLIIVDSLVSLYRLEVGGEDYQKINKQLATQYNILSNIARKHDLPVLVTNQVYSIGEDTEPTSNYITKFWSKTLIELKKKTKPNQRRAIIKKHRSLPEGKKIDFEITGKGFKKIGKIL